MTDVVTTTQQLLTVQQCLARLPIRMSERAFRQAVRCNGCYRGHRNQIFLTEEDFAAFLETLKPCNPRGDRRSSPTITRSAKPGIRAARTTSKIKTETPFDDAVSAARLTIRALCAKASATG
jgi:hypothetical protein